MHWRSNRKFKQIAPSNSYQNPLFEAIHKITITIRSSSGKDKKGSKPDLPNVVNGPYYTETSNMHRKREREREKRIREIFREAKTDPETIRCRMNHPTLQIWILIIIVIHKKLIYNLYMKFRGKKNIIIINNKKLM